MPTVAGTPLQTGAQLNPVDWLSLGGNETAGVQQSSLMRGQPPALAWWQRRSPQGPRMTGQGFPVYITSRPFSRGADAHAPHFGKLAINPIGGGVFAPYRIPTIAGPGARYQNAAIWFDVQTVPTSIRMNNSVPVETVNALIAQAHVGPSYRTTG